PQKCNEGIQSRFHIKLFDYFMTIRSEYFSYAHFFRTDGGACRCQAHIINQCQKKYQCGNPRKYFYILTISGTIIIPVGVHQCIKTVGGLAEFSFCPPGKLLQYFSCGSQVTCIS